MRAVEQITAAVAPLAACEAEEVMVASTGVIGEPLDMAPIRKMLPRLYPGLSASLWQDAAQAIMTTDTFPKASNRTADIAGTRIQITGIAKGSGMIEPDMATMLGFIFTNAAIEYTCLQALLREATDKSFNAITVDSDTSTNDTVLLVATGVQGNEKPISDPDDPVLDDFKAKLLFVMQDLAKTDCQGR